VGLTANQLEDQQVKTYAKAIVGGLVAGLGAAASALDDGRFTVQEGITATVAFLVTLGAVWITPNAGTP
jgi:hypothetical protein